MSAGTTPPWLHQRSLPPGHPALRAQIAEAIDDFLARANQTEVGRQLGVTQTTVARRGESFTAWFGDGLDLALLDREILTAVQAYLDGVNEAIGQPVQAVGALVRELRAAGELTTAIAKALEDGRINADEAAWLLDIITARREQEDQVLIPALKAIMADRSAG